MPLLNPKERRRAFDRLEQKWASIRSDTFHKLRESSFTVSNSMAINVASDRRMNHAAHKDSLADRYLPKTFRKKLETHLNHPASSSSGGDDLSSSVNHASPGLHSSAVTVNFYGIESDDAMQGFMECAKSPDHVLVLKALFSQWATAFGGSAIPLLPLSSVTADVPAVIQRGIEKSVELRKLNGSGPLHLVPGSNNSEVGGPAGDRWAALVFDWLELLDCLHPPTKVPRGSVPKPDRSTGGTSPRSSGKNGKSKTVLEDSPSFITIADWLVLACCDMCKDWKMIAALRNAYESFRLLVADKQSAHAEEKSRVKAEAKATADWDAKEDYPSPPRILAIDLLQFMESTLCHLINENNRKVHNQQYSEDIYSDDEDEVDGVEDHAVGKEADAIHPPPISPRPPSATSPSASSARRPTSAGGVARGSTLTSVPTSVTGIHTDQHNQRAPASKPAKARKKRKDRKSQVPLQRERTVAKLLACGLCPIDPEEWDEVERRDAASDKASESPRKAVSKAGSSFTTPKRPTSSPASGRVAVANETTDGQRPQTRMEGEGYNEGFEEDSDKDEGEAKPQNASSIPPPSPAQPVPIATETTQGKGSLDVTTKQAKKRGEQPTVILPLSFTTCLLLLLPHRVKMYMVKSTVRVYPNAVVADEDGAHSEDALSKNSDMDRRKQAAAFDPRGASRYYGAVTPGAREAVLYYRQVMSREGGPDSKVPKSTTEASQRIQTFVPKTKIDITKRETRDLRFARKIWS